MDFRIFEKDRDYPTLYGWWKRHNAAVIEPFLLPEFGVMVSQDGKPVLASFLYTSTCGAAMIGWTVSDPDTGAVTRVKAMETAYNALEELAKGFGVRQVMAFSSEPGLTKFMMKRGYGKFIPHDFLSKNIGADPREIEAGGLFDHGLRGDEALSSDAAVVGEEEVSRSSS